AVPQIEEALPVRGVPVTTLSQTRFDSVAAERRLRELFGVSSLDGFGNFSRAELACLGALIDYTSETQKGRLPSIKPPCADGAMACLALDPSTLANFELTVAFSGGRDDIWLKSIARTVTNGGARKLIARLHPLSADPAGIDQRLDAISFLLE